MNARYAKNAKKPQNNKPRQVYWPEPVEIRPGANELPPFNIQW